MFQSGVMATEERARRIVETAIELAERGGFEGVRLRDVASHAGVALGTLYRRFRSKEDLLIAALDQETEDLYERVLARPPRGESPLERVASFFSLATRGMCRRPNLARALIKAMASGDPDLAHGVAGFHERMERLIVVSLRGRNDLDGQLPTGAERSIAYTLSLVWFALLVGWSGGLHGQQAVIDQTRAAAELLLRGLAAA
jgi:TetR/AcrR family transcriptional regulator, cholesterol catabolism regulator